MEIGRTTRIAACVMIGLVLSIPVAWGQTMSVADGCVQRAPLRCEGWSPVFQAPGVTRENVQSIVRMDDGTLVAYARSIQGADGWISYSVVVSTTDGWRSIGATDTFDTRVHLLASGKVAATGSFRTIDGESYNGIALWDGTSWQRLGDGFDTRVWAVAELPDGRIVAGGGTIHWGRVRSFTPGGLRIWDGTTWEDVLGNAYVRGLEALDDGTFLASYSLGTNSGKTWHLDRMSTDGQVLDELGDFEATDIHMGPGGELFAITPTDDPILSGRIMRRSGGLWHEEFPDNRGRMDGSSARMRLLLTGFGEPNRVLRPVGASWEEVAAPLGGTVHGFHVSSDGELFLAGAPLSTPTDAAASVAEWSGSGWIPLSVPMPHLGVVPTEYSHNAPSRIRVMPGGGILVSGLFSDVGGTDAQNIAVFKGDHWEALGGGVAYSSQSIFVDWNNELYVRLQDGFSRGEVVRRPSVHWDGTAWSDVAGSRTDSLDFLDFHRAPDGPLYGVGRMLQPDGIWRAALLRKEGDEWRSLGISSDPGTTEIRHITTIPDGSVVVAGSFQTVEDVVSPGVMRYRAGRFEALSPLDWEGATAESRGHVSELVTWDNRAWVMANVHVTNGGRPARVASLEGDEWHYYGSGTSLWANDMAVGADGKMYIVGDFEWADQAHAYGLARWSGTTWEAVMEGSEQRYLTTVTADKTGRVYAGARSSNGMDFSSSGFTYWTPKNAVIPDPDPETSSDAASLVDVFPNPASVFVTIARRDATQATITVHDVLGRRVSRFDTSESLVSLNVSGLAPGIYFIRVETQESTVRTSVLVRR